MGLHVSVAQPTWRQKIVYLKKICTLIECSSLWEKEKIKVPCDETNQEIVLLELYVIRLSNNQQWVTSICAHCYKI